MKPHDLSRVSDSRSLSPILVVWFGLAAASFGLLLWPQHDLQSALNHVDVGLLSGADRQKLFEIETRAVMAAPLENVGLMNLGMLAHSNGNAAGAEKFYQLAANLSARDYTAQSEMIDILIARGQVSDALVRIDGVLRTKPQQSSQIYAVLVGLAQRQDGMQAVVNLLATDPPWRQNFLSFASADNAHPDTVYSVFVEMRKKHLAIMDDEIRGYLKNLIEQKNIQKAYFVWLDLLNEKQLQNVKLIYDGDFSVRSLNLFFDWTTKAVPGVTVTEVARVGGQGEQSLMVDFATARPNSNMIEQFLMLSPGTYALQGEVNLKNLHSEKGLQWQIRCEEKTSAVATMASASAGQGWDRMETEFAIPAQGCDTQKLVLRMAEPLMGPQAVTGQVYFDRLRVVRKP